MTARNPLQSFRKGFILLFAVIALLPWSAAEAQVTDCRTFSSDISADPSDILLGDSSTLVWSFDGSNDCLIRVNGESVTQYGNKVVRPQVSTTYILSTLAPDGSNYELDRVTVSVTVTSDCVTGMYGNVSAAPETIDLGGSSTLTWSLDGPNGCPLWINKRPVERFANLIVQPISSTTYVLSTSRPDGGRHELDRVTVTVANDCVRNTRGVLSTFPTVVHLGGAATLSWVVQRPAACQEVLRLNGKPVQAAGSASVRPNTTTVYGLTMDLPTGSKKLGRDVTVTVNPRTVYILGNDTYWKDLLVQSLGEPGLQVVLSPQVNMDLTGYDTPIHISESVILSGNRTPQTPGPRIYTSDRPNPLFLVRCNGDTIHGDNARILGFRLHGPHYNPMDGDDNLEKGITVTSCLNVEIANMEVAGWSGAAIRVEDDEANLRMLNPDAVKIHDNFIHHNQHKGGYGYGVDIGAGAYARIERNVFDYNRHAITGNGEAGTGYHAENNLVLKGGGLHQIVGSTRFWTHQFDEHGDANCPPQFGGVWNCGRAGDQFWFYNNSFQYLRDNALKIRGVPRVAAYINGNIFAHGGLDDAVDVFSQTRVHFGAGALRNIVNVDSYGRYGVCDFDGDGKDDLFLPTGKTWWFASAAKRHWSFLRAAPQRLDAVGLGDFDGDQRCDVLSAIGDKWYISKGGTSSWIALPGTYPIPFAQLRFADFNGDHVTDIFRRAPNGQWYVVSPGRHGWRALASSSFALSELRFGDFTGDGITDVLSRAGGLWSISTSGAGAWTRINPTLNTDLAKVLIADVDGNGTDDVVRFNLTSLGGNGTWQASWGGRTAWVSLKTVTVTAAAGHNPTVGPTGYAGNFNGSGGDDLLHVDWVRNALLYDRATGSLQRHNLFPY